MIGGTAMMVKVKLTDEEENMILSLDETAKQGVERNHIHITKALSKIIENSDLDAREFEELKRKYRFWNARNGKLRVFRCSAKCIDVIYKMRKDFHCSEEIVVLGIIYHCGEKKIA